MTDQYGRQIDYLRLSITDRCNLRCRYCMPSAQIWTPRAALLTDEELIRVARQAVALGITKFKVTGGEPLTRPGCSELVGALKQTPGVEQVTLTTNGLLLDAALDGLCEAGLDAVNLSLDTLEEDRYRQLTGYAGGALPHWRALLRRCVDAGLPTKVNVVLLQENAEEVEALAELAAQLPVDVRFIELMPIGQGAFQTPVSPEVAFAKLRRRWPDLHPVQERRGNGPARYDAAAGLQGRIGWIDAVSHRFCGSCNRVRLTCTGWLKPCLCYDAGVDLKAILRGPGGDDALRKALEAGICQKPLAHCFSDRDQVTEQRNMSQIGG